MLLLTAELVQQLPQNLGWDVYNGWPVLSLLCTWRCRLGFCAIASALNKLLLVGTNQLIDIHGPTQICNPTAGS